MVFKPFGTLARQSLAKFSNGYAQSAVAAAQSSYASSTTFPLTKLGHQFTPTKHHSTSSNQTGKRPEYTSISQRVNDSIALHNAFSTQAHEDDGQWRQFQYPKRILWSPATPLQQQQQRDSDVENRQLGLRPEKPRAASMSSVREFSTSAFDRQQVQQSDNHASDSSGQAHLDLATSTKPLEPAHDNIIQDQEASPQEDIVEGLNAASDALNSPNDVSESVVEPFVSNVENEQTPEPLVHSLIQFHQALEDAKAQGDFETVMRIFEGIKLAKVEPDISSYNYYLHAISQVETTDRIPKLLAAYDAMLSEGVQPSSYTYSILVFALVDWSEQIRHIIKKLETDKLRFGTLITDYTEQLDALRTQDAISKSLELFRQAMDKGLKDLPEVTYNYLVRALAETDKLDDMLYTLGQMEEVYSTPDMDTMAAMIKYFGRNKDINSAVECFTEASSRLTQDVSDADKVSLLNSSLLYAYFASNNENHGLQFASKLQTSSDSSSLCTMVAQQYLEVKDFENALKWTKGLSVENPSERGTIDRIYTAAADADILTVLPQLQEGNPRDGLWCTASAAESLLAYGIRRLRQKTAVKFLNVCLSHNHITAENAPMIGSAWADLFIRKNKFEDGVNGFCKTMEAVPTAEWNSFCEKALTYVTDLLTKKGVLTQKQSLTLMRLLEAGRYPLPANVARKLLVPFEGVPVKSLSVPDFTTMVVAQSASSVAPDASEDEKAKLEIMLAVAKDNQLPLWNFPAKMVEDYIPTPTENLSNDLQLWNSRFRQSGLQEDIISFANNSEVYHWSYRTDGRLPAFDMHQVLDEMDPYEKSLDASGSGTLSALLDQPTKVASGPENVKEILRIFECSKGHFQANTISRAIGTISRADGTDTDIKFNVCYKIFQDALKAMPLRTEYRKSRYAWYLMYDAMIAASLNLDMPQAAAKLHTEMLAFGASPSANTYGLYIVNLKGASEIFDEATEALAIFERAKAEGVVPTSFLYNALIGKLAKARRVDDCLFYFSQMRAFGIRPTSVTYGTVVNALCRVSDERFAEELFDEMESMDNYRPRAAPYNSMLQFFVTTRRDRTKALKYYQRMKDHHIRETPYTWRLLIDCHAACEPIDMNAAEAVISEMRTRRVHVSAIHYAALIHAKGCLQNDLDGAIRSFKDYQRSVRNRIVDDDIANVYQAIIESLVANNKMEDTHQYTTEMTMQGISMTPYIANSLIQGYANNGQIDKCEEIYNKLNSEAGNSREPSTYEAMARAYVSNSHHDSAVQVINEMASRGYPPPVMTRIVDALRNGGTHDVTYHK